MFISENKDQLLPSAGIEAIPCYMPVAGAKKYSCIYADPPWQTKAGRPLAGYKMVDGKQIFNSVDNKSRELAYPTMTINEISALPIKKLAADNAHLYMWVTNQYLLKAEKIINAWGFNYSTTLVWAKKPMGGGLGGTFKITTEFLLFATRGSLKAKRNVIGTWFEQKRQYVNGYPCHSKKPNYFYELIESVTPGDYLELFAREQRQGWDVFGNEVPNSITINAGSNGI
ncbi:MAG: S-adenosylmethionine-binding protein [Verrucomicrobia bacterium]|nr:S-adenosylmethionine-binding protein [Verrucomicrobiota bacterium]